MRPWATRSAHGLGAFQAEFREKRSRPLVRVVVLAALGVSLVTAWLLVRHPAWAGLIPLLLVSGLPAAGGLYLFGRNLAVVKPTEVAVYEAGLLYVTVLGAQPQAVGWEQIAAARVVEGAAHLVKHGISSWREETIDSDYLVMLANGRQISLGSLEYGKALLRLVASRIAPGGSKSVLGRLGRGLAGIGCGGRKSHADARHSIKPAKWASRFGIAVGFHPMVCLALNVGWAENRGIVVCQTLAERNLHL